MHMTPAPEWVAWADLATRVVWAAIAVLVAYAMSRRGHDGGWWVIVGLVLGPLAVVAAVVATRRARRRGPIVVAPGAPGGGGSDVVFVIDPANPSAGLTDPGPGVGGFRRVMFVTVIGPDTFDVQARQGELRRARAALEAAAQAAYRIGVDPRLVILEGRPDHAVVTLARDEHLALVLVPPTAAGQHLACRLAGKPGVPVADTAVAVAAVLPSATAAHRRSEPMTPGSPSDTAADHYSASLTWGQYQLRASPSRMRRSTR